MSFYKTAELDFLGFNSIGKNVQISRKASIYNAKYINIGDNVRIDDFCVLSSGESGIFIGRNVHIACFCSLIGKEKIILDDFSGLSSRVAIYSSSDDYSGRTMTNPTLPSEFCSVDSRPVFIGRHAIIGAGSIILPGSSIEEGVAIGALCVVKGNCKPWNIYAGTPLRVVKPREKRILTLEQQYLSQEKN